MSKRKQDHPAVRRERRAFSAEFKAAVVRSWEEQRNSAAACPRWRASSGCGRTRCGSGRGGPRPPSARVSCATHLPRAGGGTGRLPRVAETIPGCARTNGYDLTLRIQAISGDVLNVNAGSLYPALYRLEERGLLKSEWAPFERGRRTKVYAVTAAGRKQVVPSPTPSPRSGCSPCS